MSVGYAHGTAVRDLPVRGPAAITFARDVTTGQYSIREGGPLLDRNYQLGVRLPMGNDTLHDISFLPSDVILPGGRAVRDLRIDSKSPSKGVRTRTRSR